MIFQTFDRIKIHAFSTKHNNPNLDKPEISNINKQISNKFQFIKFSNSKRHTISHFAACIFDIDFCDLLAI